MTDQLGVIVLAAADDRALDLRPLALGEVVRAQNDLCPFINRALKSWHEGIMYAVAHEENMHLVPAFNGCLGQLSEPYAYSRARGLYSEKTQLLGHLLPFLVNAMAMPWCSVTSRPHRLARRRIAHNRSVGEWWGFPHKMGRQGRAAGEAHEKPSSGRHTLTVGRSAACRYPE